MEYCGLGLDLLGIGSTLSGGSLGLGLELGIASVLPDDFSDPF